MTTTAIEVKGRKESSFKDKVQEIIPGGGNLDLCLTCGACAAGCPATGLEDMDPRKFLRMCAMGLDEEVTKTPWVWMCTMCTRCIYVCPMKINIPQLVFNARSAWPREDRPKGILGSCDMALRNDTCSAMGAGEEDFQFVVEDVLEEYQEAQPEFAEMQAPIDKMGAEFIGIKCRGGNYQLKLRPFYEEGLDVSQQEINVQAPLMSFINDNQTILSGF